MGPVESSSVSLRSFSHCSLPTRLRKSAQEVRLEPENWGPSTRCARWAGGRGEGQFEPAFRISHQASLGGSLALSSRCVPNIPCKECQTAHTAFAHPLFIQQPLPGQAPRWVLAVGLDTSQMDGHVLGEAGLLTHLFFCNMNIRAACDTGHWGHSETEKGPHTQNVQAEGPTPIK